MTKQALYVHPNVIDIMRRMTWCLFDINSFWQHEKLKWVYLELKHVFFFIPTHSIWQIKLL